MEGLTVQLREHADLVWRYANEDYWRALLDEPQSAAARRGIAFVYRDALEGQAEVSADDARWTTIADQLAVSRLQALRPGVPDAQIARWLAAARVDGHPGALLRAALKALNYLQIAPINHGEDVLDHVEVIEVEESVI